MGAGRGKYVVFHVFKQILLYCFTKVSKINDKKQDNLVPWLGGGRGMSEINQSYYLSDEISKIIYVFWNLLSDYADLNKGFFNWKLLFST